MSSPIAMTKAATKTEYTARLKCPPARPTMTELVTSAAHIHLRPERKRRNKSGRGEKIAKSALRKKNALRKNGTMRTHQGGATGLPLGNPETSPRSSGLLCGEISVDSIGLRLSCPSTRSRQAPGC